MNTIILGGSGFLGPQILTRYPQIVSVGRTRPVNAVHHVYCPSLDNLPEVLDSLEFDTVIMMIGSSNHHELNSHNMLAIEKNLKPIKQVFHHLRTKKIKKVISFTSILLYDKDRMTLPVDESQPLSPYQNQYIFSKYLAEETAKFYSDVPNIIARMTNIYGPSSVLGRPDVVNQLIESLIFNKKASVINTEPQRDFIYAVDAADAIIKLLDSTYTGVVNLASGSMCSIGDIVQILENLSGIKIDRLNGEVTGHLKYVADISLLKKVTNWVPQYSIEAGLTETYTKMVEMYG
jgi:nucleoside-diphosphate-sugar epimerase